MTSDLTREHLRAALEAVISAETTRVRELFKSTDATQARGICALRPLMRVLEILRTETEGREGLEIFIAEAGHMATVELKSVASSQRLTLSMSFDGSTFEVKEYASYSFTSNSPYERAHRFNSGDEALAIIVTAVGKHIGSAIAVDERSR